MANPIPAKIIFEVRYKPELKFFRLYLDAALRIEAYSNWHYNHVEVTWTDPEQHCSLTFNSHRALYEQDSPGKALEEKNTQELIDVVLPALEIESMRRVGYRTFFLTPVPMDFDSLVSVTEVSLMPTSEQLMSLIPGSITDLGYAWYSKEGDDLYRIKVGPVRKDELKDHITFSKRINVDIDLILRKLPETSILVDIDVIRPEERLDNLSGFLVSARTTAYRFAKDISDYILKS